MFRTLIVLCLLVAAAAFGPARMSARSSMALGSTKMVKSAFSNEMCEERKVDKNGKCPGEAGYYPPSNKAPTDFAEFQREMAAKKAAAAAAKK